HAEAVDRAPIAGVVYQFVVCGTQLRMAGETPETCGVDQRLRMLDTQTDGKGFGFEMDAPVLEHAEGVAGAVPQSEHYVAAVQGLSARKHHTFYPSPFDDQVGNPALEAYFATQRDDLFAHLRYDARQAKRADVRLADIKNFRRCTGAHELPHHLAAVEFRVFYLAVELAIGEQARAALAKLDVGFRC